MAKKYKVILYILIGLIVISGLIMLGNSWAKQKITIGIKEELAQSEVTYKDIRVDILNGSAFVDSPKLSLGNATITSEGIKVLDLNYREYFSSKKIVFDRIVFRKPVIIIRKTDSLSTSQPNSPNKKFQEDIKIRHLVIKDGILKIINKDSLSNDLFVSLKKMDIYDLNVNKKSVKNKIPFDYRDVFINSDSLYYLLDPFHDLQIKSLILKKGNVDISELRVIPRFSKAEFDKRQIVEKDRFELNVPKINMKNFVWDFNGNKLQLESSTTNINEASLHIYRNKLLSDDHSRKPLYSRKLRELETKLKFDEILVTNSQVVYEEKTDVNRSPGKVKFTNLRMDIANVTNINMESANFPLTTLDVKSNFMGDSKLGFKMEFNVRDPKDDFKFSGNLLGISGEEMNSFLKPAMNMEVQGEISSMYFNFYGNDINAIGDSRLEYHDFKVEVLRKDGQRKNKFLSSIANLILKNNVSNKKMEQKNITAIRDQTKSFWNFLWLCIRNAALKSFI